MPSERLDTVEAFADDLKQFAVKQVGKKGRGLYVMDSLDALSTKRELVDGMDKATMQPVLAVWVHDGDQPYYTARHVGITASELRPGLLEACERAGRDPATMRTSVPTGRSPTHSLSLPRKVTIPFPFFLPCTPLSLPALTDA